MTPKGLLDQINQLPVDERIKLVEDIWDSIAVTPESVPVQNRIAPSLTAVLSTPPVTPGFPGTRSRRAFAAKGESATLLSPGSLRRRGGGLFVV